MFKTFPFTVPRTCVSIAAGMVRMVFPYTFISINVLPDKMPLSIYGGESRVAAYNACDSGPDGSDSSFVVKSLPAKNT